MSEFVRICSQAEIPAAGNVKEFMVGDRAIVVLEEFRRQFAGLVMREPGPMSLHRISVRPQA